MAHRGPLREIYLGLSVMLLVEKAQKNITPNQTHFILDAEDDFLVVNSTTAPLLTAHTPPAKGLLSLFFAFLMPDFTGIAEDILTMVAMEILAYCFVPAMMIIKRFLVLIIKLAHRHFFTRDARIAELAYQISSLAKVGEIHIATISSLDRLLGESELKVVDITKDFDNKSARLAAEKFDLLTSLRAIVDPAKIHPLSTSIISLIQDLEARRKQAVKDLKRANKNIEDLKEDLKEAQDEGQLAQKDEQISQLNTTKAALSEQVANLTKQVHDAAEEAERAKEAAAKEQKKLKKRVSDAETTAREGRSKRDYDSLRDQFDAVLVNLRTTEQALRDEETKTQELQANAVNGETARSEAESQLTAARNNLQLANDKIASLERRASTQSEEAQEANKKLEAEKRRTVAAEKEADAAKKATEAAKAAIQAAETKARVAETKSAKDAATANELQQRLEVAAEQAGELHESNELLRLRAESAEEAFTGKEADVKPEPTENVSNDKLVTENNGLRALLDSSNKQAQEAYNAGYQQAIVNNPPPNVDEQIQEALNNERSQAQLALGNTGARWEEAVREEVGRRWATESEKHEETTRQATAEIERLNMLGRGVEERLTNTQAELTENMQRLAESQAEVQRQASDLRTLQGRNDSLTAEQSVYNKNIKDLGNLFRETNDKLKTAKEELAAAKKDLLNAKAADQVEEIEAMERDLERARELMEEIAEKPMDDSAHYVFEELVALNSAIAIAKLTLEASGPKVDVKAILEALEGHEVEEDLLNDVSIDERPVLVNQSRMANELLSALIEKLTSEKSVRKDTLLARVYKPRGDETSHKRKLDDGEGDAPSKRKDTSSMGIGFGLGRSQQQGSSSLSTNDATDPQGADALSMPQHDFPPPQRIGEATGPQIQGIDHTHHSLQPSPPSSPTQNISPAHTPAIWSAAPSQSNPYSHPKPTKIPGPKPKAHLTPSERQERLAIRGHQDQNAAPAQSPVPFAGEGSTGFSFSVPKNISSADIVKTVPAQPSHNRIFHGLSVLGAAMADKNSALPGLPPPEKDEVIDFGSSTINQDHESDSEADDGFPAHTVSDDEEDDETIWEDALYPKEPEDHLDLDLGAHTSTNDDDDNWPSTIRALDMTEQNYEEQAAEAARAMQGIQEEGPPKKEGQPQNGEEDNFHINLDSD